ncbi:MAG: T9SS type A sorting domain-containing protein [Ignavibacteriae bacterium]|nr:T9SS type A sorting domain-containing protein [Ignavibacteriota bacterium]
MIRLSYLLFLLCVLFAGTAPLSAQDVTINELYNSSGNDEWVELLVVSDSVDLRGWNLRDFSSGGAAQNPLVFTTSTLWSNLRAGTVIVVARPENTSLAEDFDPSDYLLVIKSSNGIYFSGTAFLFAGSSDAIQIRTTANVHVFGVSWGAANASSIPDPKVHFTGSSSSGTSISFNEDSLPELPIPTNWTINNSAITLGTGNTATNASWLNQLRSRADGSGTARIQPDTLNAGDVGSLEITYGRDAQFSITALRVIIPPAFIWSRQASDVTYTNMTATLIVNGDTITFDGVTFSADSTIITLLNVTAPDSTAFYPFRVQSRSTSFGNVNPVPIVTVFGHAAPIASVKGNDSLGIPLRLGELATIRAIVTAGNQFGGPSYLQDNSGGIAIFGSSFSTVVSIGDEVNVSGVVSPFNGLSELVNPRLHQVVTTGNVLDPLTVTCAQLFNDGAMGVELYEGLLVRLNSVSVGDTFGNPIATWAVSGAGTNYRLFDATGHVDIRVDNDVNFANTPAPQGLFDLMGVVGQFKPSSPFIGGYQVLPRFASDIFATGPIIASFPVETDIQPTGLTVAWETINIGTSYVRYGITPALELGVVGDDSLKHNHNVTLTALIPGTVYYIRAFSVAGTDTSYASTLVASTASPPQTTGQRNVYFNKSVNTSLAWFEQAQGNQHLPSKIIARINNAQRSVDAALYSLSGTVGSDIATALINAKNRGVKVRVIGEYDNRGTSPWSTLTTNGIPVIFDLYGANDGSGLHHNKFFVLDYRGGAPESVWVFTGSWNPTDPGTTSDYQNAIEIQDVALAGAYTLEFNEMWGSNGDVPNPSVSRFGARKTNNTPHKFVIGGRSVESYFSPSDRVTSKLLAAVNGADQSVGFALLTLTRSDIANALVAKKNAGKAVRGVLDNGTDAGSQYSFLVSNNVDVLLKTGSGLLHHKYAIIDAENPYWNSVTITGSHNWSNNAENSNDENTLFVYDGNITNQYLQEFAARYYQFGGTDTIRVGVESADGDVPGSFSLSQNYPNPFNPSTTIQFALPVAGKVTLKVFNVIGQEVVSLLNEPMNAGTYRVRFTAGGLASGVYFYRLEAVPSGGIGRASFLETKKFILLK